MIFNFTFRNTSRIVETASIKISYGACIVGLVLKNKRPQTVTLDYEELKALISDPKYACKVVTALYQVTKNKQSQLSEAISDHNDHNDQDDHN